MYNKVITIGRLTRDIDFKTLPNGMALAKSAIATSYKHKSQNGEQKEEVCYLDFTMFGRSAEIAKQYLRKGSKVMLEGRLVFETWVGQDGANRSKHSLNVDTMKMLDSKAETMGTSFPPTTTSESITTSTIQNDNIPVTDINEDEIPF